MKLSFEKSVPGRKGIALPKSDVPHREPAASLLRAKAPNLPELSELDVVRHYTGLSRCTHGVDNGFYPLGSCTMKYNPRINDELAGLPGFTDVHPLQPEADAQGSLEAMYLLSGLLAKITGMDEVTLQPAAGAHGEWTALSMIRAYHHSRGDFARDTVLVPDSAHGTNPASATMAGFHVVSVPSLPDGCVDVEALRSLAGPNTAAIMLTNPNTLGLFEKHISEIDQIVHGAGGLLYYDGANLNAIMGIVRPGDMGFDAVHLNLHKTFSTPHGGGGPGSGPVGCKAFLSPFLPKPVVTKDENGYHLDDNRPQSIGKVKGFYGNFLVSLRALCYILSLGSDGLLETSRMAVLNANYLMTRLSKAFSLDCAFPCKHEFVLSVEALKKETGVSAMDLAKGLLDNGIHPPTMYFPLIVPEALMFEPTETESKQTLDNAVEVLAGLFETAHSNPQALHDAPFSTPVRRLDEVGAARNPVLRYAFPTKE